MKRTRVHNISFEICESVSEESREGRFEISPGIHRWGWRKIKHESRQGRLK